MALKNEWHRSAQFGAEVRQSPRESGLHCDFGLKKGWRYQE